MGVSRSTDTRQRLGDRQLHYLAAAADAQSIRGAADRLDIEPSVVSRQIQLLEQQLDVALLDRHGRGVAPTEAAQIVLDYYRKRVSDEAVMLAQLEDLKGLQRGQVHMVASEGFIAAIIETVLNDFCVQFPQIRVQLEVMAVSDVVRYVAEDRADIGLAFSPPPINGIQVHKQKRHPICVIANPHHPVAKLPAEVTLKDLEPFPFGLVPPEFGIGQVAKMAEFSEKVALNRMMVTNSLAALKHFVSAGLGLTLLPKINVQPELQSGELIAKRVRSPAFETAHAQLVVRDKRHRSQATEMLLQRLDSMPWF
jgi:DNA-binding transcriptional LysR family regulator